MPSDSESSSSLSSLGECGAHGGVQVSGAEMSNKEHHLPGKLQVCSKEPTLEHTLQIIFVRVSALTLKSLVAACLDSEHMQVITQM